MRGREALYRITVLALLTIHAVLLWGSTRQHYVVLDEAGHVASGLSHWQTGTFHAYRVNPPLPRLLAALPLWASVPNSDYSRLYGLYSWDRVEFLLGEDFSAANQGRYYDLVLYARTAGIAWSLLGGWLVARWARELYGRRAGLLALTVWTFEPTLLALGPLVVPDLPTTVMGFAATYVFWHYLRQPTWTRCAAAGVLLGIAQLCKMTLLLLYGVWPLLALLCGWLGGGSPERPQPLRRGLAQGALIVGLSLVVLNAGYAFHGAAPRLGSLTFISEAFAGSQEHRGNRFADSWLSGAVLPVPADYLLGLDAQQRDFEARLPSYLAGEWRYGGWWDYYLYALAVKVPLGFLGLFLLSLGLTALGHRCCASPAAELTMLLPAGVILLVVSAQTGFNHHMRYVLPLFPFAIVSMSKVAYFVRREHPRVGALVAVLLFGGVGSSLAVYPHFLSYFNEAAGGPDRGHNHLINSNIDWGQDLLHLKHWLDAHPEARPLGLAYFQLIDPRLEGIEYHRVPLQPTPGYFAVSVNFVRGDSYTVRDGSGGKIQAPLGAYSYFQRFQPIAKAGYSIFIYRVTPEQANAARAEMGLPPWGADSEPGDRRE